MTEDEFEIFREVYIALMIDSASDHIMDTEDEAWKWAERLFTLAQIHTSTMTNKD